VKETYKNGGGEKKTNTLWIRCVAWQRWGEIADPKEPGVCASPRRSGK
jgi:single-stranded DNA-binding protein